MSILDRHLEQVQYCSDLPAWSHFQCPLCKKNGSIVGMNVTAYQEKKKEEETKTGVNKAGEERRLDFRHAVCCPSAVVQAAARQKNGARGMPRIIKTLGKANSHFDPNQTGSGTAPPHEAAVDWCSAKTLNV